METVCFFDTLVSVYMCHDPEDQHQHLCRENLKSQKYSFFTNNAQICIKHILLESIKAQNEEGDSIFHSRWKRK